MDNTDIKNIIDEIKKLKTSVDININIQIIHQRSNNTINHYEEKDSKIDSINIVKDGATIINQKIDDINNINNNINNNDRIELFVHKFMYENEELNQITTLKEPLVEISHILRESIKSHTIIDEFIDPDFERDNISINILDISARLIYINTIDYETNRSMFNKLINIYEPHKFTKLLCVNNIYKCKITNTQIFNIIKQ